MSVTASLYLAAGVLGGAAHACLLWKAARPPFRWLAAVSLRLTAVTAVLVFAAIHGELVPMAAGWSGGFPATVLALSLRRPA